MLSHDMYKKLIYGSMIESETIGLFFNGEDGEKTGKMLSSLDLYDYDTNKNVYTKNSKNLAVTNCP